MSRAGRPTWTQHAPIRTDDELDDLARCVAGQAPEVTVAVQGTVVDLR